MKKLINKVEHIVPEMCMGIVMAHPELEFISKYKVITKKNRSKNKVNLISGGGSGHEPAHAGFIGRGMLDVAVCGDVFASPSQIQVYQAIKATANDKGTLLIIKNYTGDIMNFTNAALMAKEDGLKVDFVKVDDDIAVTDSLWTVGRRGVAGTVFVHKIAGAAAEQGATLPEVKTVAEKVNKNVKSIGIALTSCTVPAKGSPTFDLADDEIEYGIGIHGEPGIKKEKLQSSKEMIKRMVGSLCQELKLDKGGRVAVLINGFGASPLMELYLVNSDVYKELAAAGIEVVRSFVGNYMTSIDMAGASISILKLDPQLEGLLNAPCDTPAFKVSGPAPAPCLAALVDLDKTAHEVCYEIATPKEFAVIKDGVTVQNMVYIVDVMADVVIKNEVPFCELDSHAGDGDFGTSVAKGFKQLKAEWESLDKSTMGKFFDACSIVIMEHCGGASGPVWGSAFRAAGKYCGTKESLSVAEFAQMLQAIGKGIQTTGERSFGRGAVVGDKTLIDALAPCADAWKKAGECFETAFKNGAAAAVAGAESTKEIAAKMGRAGTVGDRSIGHPDAGAHALGVIFTAIVDALQF